MTKKEMYRKYWSLKNRIGCLVIEGNAEKLAVAVKAFNSFCYLNDLVDRPKNVIGDTKEKDVSI